MIEDSLNGQEDKVDVVVTFAFGESWNVLFLFGVLGLPLVLQDLKDSTVSTLWLAGITLVWWTATLCMPDVEGRLIQAASVLVIGWGLIAILPDRLGEVDVLFISGMACLFSFWSLIFSLALGCVGAFALYLWLYRGDKGVLSMPIPFLPCLYWGGLTVLFGGLLT